MNGLWYAIQCTPVRTVLGRPRDCGLGRRLHPTRVGEPDTARFACAGTSRQTSQMLQTARSGIRNASTRSPDTAALKFLLMLVVGAPRTKSEGTTCRNRDQ